MNNSNGRIGGGLVSHWPVGFVCLAIGLSAGFSGAYFERRWNPPPPPLTAVIPAEHSTARPQPINPPSFSEIVASNRAAVVAISVRGTASARGREQSHSTPSEGTPPPGPRAAIGRDQDAGPLMANSGAGFIVAPNGIIMTNAHLFNGDAEVRVTLADRREFKASLIGTDVPTDTAVLRIAADNLPTVHVGTPAGVQVGDWVLAIGAPYGFDHSVTAGIISAKSRALPNGGYVPFLQTDVALNPGNSGGPLFNADGEVIGINSRIFSQSGGYEGISFAVPIDMALNVERDLLEHGKVDHARLGLDVQDLDQSLADAFGLKSPSGVLIADVYPSSPAVAAGLKPGDVILAVNGQKISDLADMGAASADLRSGTAAVISVWRQGRALSITLKADADGPLTEQEAELPLSRSRFGLVLRPPMRGFKPASRAPAGLIVDEVAGPAAAAGIQPGDVVLAVNGQPLTNPRQLLDLESHIERHAALLVQHGASRRFVPVELE